MGLALDTLAACSYSIKFRSKRAIIKIIPDMVPDTAKITSTATVTSRRAATQCICRRS